MPTETRRERFAKRLAKAPPPAALALLYLATAILGTLLLKLPFSLVAPISWGDALFTAVSAITVTGLGVVDPATHFTPFGEGVIALLIQLGGLGLMVFAVLVLSAFGLPVGMPTRTYLREDLSRISFRDLRRLTRRMVKLVLVCELAGAACLAIVFVPDFGVAAGLWHAVFHSISAFNNAGFSTLPEGLATYALDPLVNLSIPALFIIGGLGYVVVMEIQRDRRWRKLSLHSKLMLTGTAGLIVFSVAMFAVLEWNNPRTLGDYHAWPAKLIVSWFQGVTTRTAGFNTTDIGGIDQPTAVMFIALMLVGGGPASTAGGIKVTTLFVMILATIAFFRRRTELHAFGRSIPVEEVLQVAALISISLLVVFTGVFLVTINHPAPFLDVAFEVASAFGTVGLSRGATGDLDGFGRAVIVALMFIGRVGPLTLGFFLATRSAPRVRYPAGRIYLG